MPILYVMIVSVLSVFAGGLLVKMLVVLMDGQMRDDQRDLERQPQEHEER